MTMELDLGLCLFMLDDAFFSTVHGGKKFLDYVWVRLLSMGPKDHKQKRSYLMRSPYCSWGERKNLKSMGKASTIGLRDYIPDRTISCQL